MLPKPLSQKPTSFRRLTTCAGRQHSPKTPLKYAQLDTSSTTAHIPPHHQAQAGNADVLDRPEINRKILRPITRHQTLERIHRLLHSCTRHNHVRQRIDPQHKLEYPLSKHIWPPLATVLSLPRHGTIMNDFSETGLNGCLSRPRHAVFSFQAHK